MLRRRMMRKATGGIPAAYRRVEYLENDGTQYIATNYVPATDYTDIDLVFAFTQNQADDQMLFGSRKGTYAKVWQCEYYGHSRWFVSNGMYKWRSALSGSAPDLNTRYELSTYGNTFTVNGSSVGTQTVATSSNDYPMYIFAWNNAGSAQHINVGARIYSLSFAENGEPAANFVPCVRIADNKPGMYDTVSGTFYTNAGSGEFIIPT